MPSPETTTINDTAKKFRKEILALITALGISIVDPNIVVAKEPSMVQVENKTNESKKALEYVIKSFENGDFQKRSSIIGGNPSSREVCQFNDNWMQNNKEDLARIWKYVESSESSQQILSDFFKINQAIVKSLENHFVTKGQAKKLAKNESEFKLKIDKFLSSPKETVTSCGIGFDLVFGYISTPEIIKNSQQAIKSLFVEISKNLIKKIDEKKLDKESSEIIPILLKLVFSATGNTKIK